MNDEDYERATQVALLNDRFRKTFTGGRVLVTASVQASPHLDVILDGVRRYEFNGTDGNNPYGENDFGSFEVAGDKYFFKIDYYDADLRYHSPDPLHDSRFAELYDTPWDKAASEVYFCSDDCEQAYCSSGSFDYAYCDGCERQVCEQNPSNGWMTQFRDQAELGRVCLRCYEKEILNNGQPREDFEGERIHGGMFFSRGNAEPAAVGFQEVAGFDNYFVPSSVGAARYNSVATGLVNAGAKVITAYERLAIGGLEGYITMMMKR